MHYRETVVGPVSLTVTCGHLHDKDRRVPEDALPCHSASIQLCEIGLVMMQPLVQRPIGLWTKSGKVVGTIRDLLMKFIDLVKFCHPRIPDSKRVEKDMRLKDRVFTLQ